MDKAEQKIREGQRRFALSVGSVDLTLSDVSAMVLLLGNLDERTYALLKGAQGVDRVSALALDTAYYKARAIRASL